MIWCIIGVTLFILALIFNKLVIVYRDKYRDTRKRFYIKTRNIFDWLRIPFFLISLLIIGLSSISIIYSHTYTGKSEIQEAKDQHDAYVTLLEENKDITVQNQLYKDIVEYNTTLRKNKHYSKSPWTNWFYSDEWNEIEEIEIK